MSLKKLVQDECYAYEICNQFCNFGINSSVADLSAFNLITQIIESLMETSKSFIQTFTKFFVDVEDPFRGLDLNCTRLLGFDIGNPYTGLHYRS